MVPLSIRLGEAASLALLLAVVFVSGLIAALLWSPFLLADRLRALFWRLPSNGSVAPSYLLLAVGSGLPYGAGTWALLVAWSSWYAVLLSAPLFLMAVVAAFPARRVRRSQAFCAGVHYPRVA